jgi:EAL and modified HD-GYP domain-containing signal transduction protein
MEYYVSRRPVFNRRKEVYGYKLELCPSLRNRYYSMYGEPDDAQALYRLLCLVGFDDSPDTPVAVLDMSFDLSESLIPLLPREHVVVEFSTADNSVTTDLKEIRRLKARGYRILYEADDVLPPLFLQLVDLIKLDSTTLNVERHFERVKANKGNAKFYAGGIDTWEDFNKALVIGCDYFHGDFYKKPLPGKQSSLKSFNTSILRVMGELSLPEPGFKEITGIIEHDVNLSYSLLKLVNSAYIAPKFKVKTISQAVTILGLHEMNTFISTIMMRQMRSPENIELLRLSLVRGKFMELLAGMREIPQKGSEAFFVGMFSLIDVILGRSMAEIMDELPLTDAVKATLLGGEGELKALLDMVTRYEAARWEEFDSIYRLDDEEQRNMMDLYLSALKWAESFDI